ncbi:MAG: hypothetical protein ACO32J_01130 [Phycisphaerales bacterium]
MRTLLALLIVAAPLALASPVAAQFGGRAAMSEAARPDVLPRDLLLIMDTLQLEEWQRPIMESLIDDYNLSFTTGWQQTIERMKQVAMTSKGGSAKGLMEPIVAWLPEKQKLFTEFMANVKGQLSEVQQERFPKLERAMRREKALADSDLAGEGLDLVSLTRQMELPADAMAAAQPSLDEYELALDAALVQRDAAIDGLVGPLAAAMEEGNPTEGFAIQGRIMQARAGVRDVQDAWIEKLAVVIPAPHGNTFRERALAAGYREAWQPDQLAGFFQAVLAIPSLTEEQRSGIEAIRVTWSGQLADLRERMVAAMREDGPRKPERDAANMAAKRAAKDGGVAPRPAPETIVPLRVERSKLINETRESVKALLTPEQLEGLAAGDPSLRPTPSVPGAPSLGGKGDGAPGELPPIQGKSIEANESNQPPANYPPGKRPGRPGSGNDA